MTMLDHDALTRPPGTLSRAREREGVRAYFPLSGTRERDGVRAYFPLSRVRERVGVRVQES